MLKKTIRKIKSVKIKKPPYFNRWILNTIILLSCLVYGLLSTLSIVPNITFGYVYPLLKQGFHLEWFSLSYSGISFNIELGPFNFLILTFLHSLEITIYFMLASSVINIASDITIQKRLTTEGYRKFRSIKKIKERKRQERISAVKASFSHITLKHERTARKERDKSKQGAGFGTGFLSGFILGLIIGR